MHDHCAKADVLPLSLEVAQRPPNLSGTVVPLDSGGTARLIFRWRAATRPWWLTLSTWAVIVPADFLMSRDMLRGVKRRTERPRTNKTLISDHESQLNLSSGSDHITTPNQA
jgi:hypothetical protein